MNNVDIFDCIVLSSANMLSEITMFPFFESKNLIQKILDHYNSFKETDEETDSNFFFFTSNCFLGMNKNDSPCVG